MKDTTKKWQFRELRSEDMFPMFNLIKKIGIKEFKECFQSDSIKKMIFKKGAVNVEEIGLSVVFDIGGIIIGNLVACENDIYKLLVNTSNLSLDEIKKLSMAEFTEMIIDFIKKPDFADFFSVVSKLFK